jgi:hypothetical protein
MASSNELPEDVADTLEEGSTTDGASSSGPSLEIDVRPHLLAWYFPGLTGDFDRATSATLHLVTASPRSLCDASYSTRLTGTQLHNVGHIVCLQLPIRAWQTVSRLRRGEVPGAER